MSSKAFTPAYIQIVQREDNLWHFFQPSRLVSTKEHSPDSDFFTGREERYGLTKAKIALEVRRLTGGTDGYDIADMKHKRYDYCGDVWNDVRIQLVKMGIARSGLPALD